MTKERLLWPDVARGILILIVVLGHTLQHGDYEHNVLWNIIYSFHMAAFFAISGYVSYKPELQWSTIGKRFGQLMVPFFIWSLLQSLCLNNREGIKILEFLVFPDCGFWFVYVLFFIITLVTCLNKMASFLQINPLYTITMGGLMMIGLMVIYEWRIFGFQFIAFYFPFYAFGYFINRYKFTVSFPVALSIGLVWLVSAIFWHGHEVPIPLASIRVSPCIHSHLWIQIPFCYIRLPICNTGFAIYL